MNATIEIDTSQDEIIQRWQEKAIRLDPYCDIEKYFSPHYSYFELLHLAGLQPARFLPILIIDADECSKCEKPFNWEDPATIAYIPQFEGYGGEPIPEDDRDLFLLDIGTLEEMAICPACMRKMVRRYLALRCCARAARRREKLEAERDSAAGQSST